MRDGAGEDVAHGALLLRAVRPAVRGGRVPRARGQALLPRRLLRHVRAQVRRLQQAHHGELHLGAQHAVAPGLLRLQGAYRGRGEAAEVELDALEPLRQVEYATSF